MVNKVLALFSVMMLAAMFGGCSCNPAPLSVTVELDDAMRQSLQSRQLEVHLVAVNANENERWENYSMTEYWKADDKMRESILTYKMVFDPSVNKPQTLSAKDPIWQKWMANHATRLFVLTQLPGLVTDDKGDKDPRRQILPLESCRWKDTNVRLKVQTTGIITMTPPKPAE